MVALQRSGAGAGCSTAIAPAPVYPESMITRAVPVQRFTPKEDRRRDINGDDYRLEVAGLRRTNAPGACRSCTGWCRSARTRHICVEGRSAIGRRRAVRDLPRYDWRGFSQPATSSFKCADDYYTSIDMATALHPQTIIAR
ncbi:hypothetical protein M8494_17850 [Serratia ureilytica]